jgi:hypothetical protein
VCQCFWSNWSAGCYFLLLLVFIRSGKSWIQLDKRVVLHVKWMYIPIWKNKLNPSWRWFTSTTVELTVRLCMCLGKFNYDYFWPNDSRSRSCSLRFKGTLMVKLQWFCIMMPLHFLAHSYCRLQASPSLYLFAFQLEVLVIIFLSYCFSVVILIYSRAQAMNDCQNVSWNLCFICVKLKQYLHCEMSFASLS